MAYTSFYSEEELAELGLKTYGKDVNISRKCSIYSPENISIGNHVRIDDFCLLSGTITLGNYVHIAAYTALYGACGITVGDYSTCSPRCTIFSASDDFSGEVLFSPMAPAEYTHVIGAPVVLHRFSNVGAGCIILPGVILHEGAAVGAMNLVRKSIPEWTIWTGFAMLERIKARSQKMKELAENLECENESHKEG